MDIQFAYPILRFTVEEFNALSEETKNELINGRVIWTALFMCT